MINIIKKITSVLLIIIISIPLNMLNGLSKPYVYAASPNVSNGGGFDVFINGDGDVCIVTNDKKKTSDIYYRTVGFTMSRCVYNPAQKQLHATKQFIGYAQLPSKTETVTYGGREINVFKVAFADLVAKINAVDATWGQEVQDAMQYGQSCYLRFDAIMYVFHGTHMASGPYSNEAPIDGANPNAIIHAERWANPDGLKTHYNRYLLLSSGVMEPPEDYKDHHVTPTVNSGEGKSYFGDFTGLPNYAGGNVNLEGYDVTQGVPSNKTLTAYAEAYPWYGCLDVWARMVSHYYIIKYRYKWRSLPGDIKTYPDEDGPENAKKELEEKEEEERKRLAPLLETKYGHDTKIDQVFHHWIKLEEVKDHAGNILPRDKIKGDIEFRPSSYDPATPTSDSTIDPYYELPEWQSGYKWLTKEEAAKPEDQQSWTTEEKDSYLEVDSIEVPSDAAKVEKLYKKVKPSLTKARLTCIVDRDFWDDEYNDVKDKKIKIYAAFEYIDPYRTNFYDFDQSTLINDAYESKSLSFPQEIDTEMEAKKGMAGTEFTLTRPKGTDAHIEQKQVVTSDYLTWSGQKSNLDCGKLTITYKDDITALETKIFKETRSANDYVRVKNPIDKGPATVPKPGTYLGNVAGSNIVIGCDFRDGHWLGYDSIGKYVKNGQTNGDGKSENGNTDPNLSKYWDKCKHSAAQDEQDSGAVSNPYIMDNQQKLSGKNAAWEKLTPQTDNIEKKTSNGQHGTYVEATYIQEIVLPGGGATKFGDEAKNGHIYSEEVGAAQYSHNYSETTGAHAH